MMRKKRRYRSIFFLFILLILLLWAKSAYAQGKGYGVHIRLMVPPQLDANPGEIVSASFIVENTTDSEETFEEALSLPEGWLEITPPDVFILGAKQQTVRMLAFQIPTTSSAKDYTVTYSVRSQRDYAISDAVSISISVLSVDGIHIFSESAPDMIVGGESYEITARIANKGNTALTMLISARSSNDYPLTLSTHEIVLEPGGNTVIAISVKTPSQIPKSLNHTVFIEAVSKEDSSIRSVLSVTTGIVSQHAKIDLYHRIPASLTLKSMGRRDTKDSDGFDIELEGKGTLEEGGRRWIDFSLRGPDTHEKGLYGERDEYYINYFDPDLDFRLGDQSYGLSHLTSYSRYGRGIEACYHPENSFYGLGTYYVKNRFTTPDWEEGGVYIKGAFSPQAQWKLNYLQKEWDRHEKRGSKTTDDIYSIEGTFVPTKNTRLSLEYARGERSEENGAGKVEDDAYRVNLSGLAGTARYSFVKTHAEPDFYGYYNDSDYMATSVSFPLFGQKSSLVANRTRGFLAYSTYETNLDKRLDKGDISAKETLFQAGINHSLSNGWYAQLAYDNFSRKDRLFPSEYDTKEKAYRFSLGRSTEKFNYRVEARYADQHDLLTDESSSPWNYSFYISYIPSSKLLFTLYGGFGDNSAISGSRLLSDQDNWGLSFRWQATEQLILSGWYTKYNFNSKDPESNNYQFEVSLAMPDESRWAFKIRRYDWEYGNETETDYSLSYTVPIGISVSKKKSLGILSGSVWERVGDVSALAAAQTSAAPTSAAPNKAPVQTSAASAQLDTYSAPDETKKALPNAIITLNGSKVATDASGKFTFSAPPGTYFLDIDRSTIGLEKTALEKLPMKVHVQAGQTTSVELTIVNAATLSGEIVLLKEETPPSHTIRDEAVTVGNPDNGAARVPAKLEGILVELSKNDETIRMMTDSEGKFSFLNIRPGAWNFKVYDYDVPAYHYIQNPEEHITLAPGEKRNITIKVVPKKRQIEILEEGIIRNQS